MASTSPAETYAKNLIAIYKGDTIRAAEAVRSARDLNDPYWAAVLDAIAKVEGPPMNLDTQADLITQVQTVLRQARDGRDNAKLREGNELMLSEAFMRLPLDAQADCRALYRDAFVAVSGGLVG